MSGFLDNIFGRPSSPPKVGESTERNLQVATAVLLLEMARADDEFTDQEQTTITVVLKKHFGITNEEVEEILRATDRELDQRIDIYYFTNQINEHFDSSQKMRIIDMIWRVVYADRRLDGHEDYLVHRFARLLRLQHSQLIDAKLRVKHGE